VTEHKSYPIDDFKALDEEGTFEALVSVFGNVDFGGDIVQKGAFSASLKEWEGKNRSIPVLWSHDADLPPIGVVSEAREDSDGLRVKAKLLVNDNPQAKAIHAAMKAGALAEFSFGYTVHKDEKVVHEGQTVRRLKELGLMEVSPVFRGMNPATQLEAVKSLDTDALAEANRLMEEANELQRKLVELSEKQADVAMKAVADSLQDVLDKFETKEVKAGEQQDNPTPNDSVAAQAGDESEEAKARIRQLQAEKPIHLLGGNDEQQAESPEGEASSG
jgi:HK97 family phage prohead protease